MGALGNYVPLRIEWRLATPWVPPSQGLHLDGLIAHAIVQRAVNGAGEFGTGAQINYDDLLVDLPFAKFSGADLGEAEPDGQRWVWKASLLEADVVGSERRYLTTKTPISAIAEHTASGLLSAKGGAKVDTIRGYYKAGAMHYTLEHVRSVSAWCVGDPDRLADLLGDIESLGSKTRLGHGAIREVEGQLFSMVEDERALALWKRRLMPTPELDFVPVQAPLRSPYWRRDRAVLAWRPIQ